MSNNDRDVCEQPISCDELGAMMKTMKNNSSPGEAHPGGGPGYPVTLLNRLMLPCYLKIVHNVT